MTHCERSKVAGSLTTGVEHWQPCGGRSHRQEVEFQSPFGKFTLVNQDPLNHPRLVGFPTVRVTLSNYLPLLNEADCMHSL